MMGKNQYMIVNLGFLIPSNLIDLKPLICPKSLILK